MKKDHSRDPELKLLLEDFGSSRPPSSQRTAKNGAPAPFAGPPAEFLLENFSDRRARWLADYQPSESPSDSTPLRLLVEEFEPVERFRERNAGQTVFAAPYDGPPPNFLVNWDDDVHSARQREARAVSVAAHLALIILALLQPHFDPRKELAERDRSDYTEISLMAPSPEQLRELTQRPVQPRGQTKAFTGLTERPAPTPAPPKPLESPSPAPAPAPQPIEPRLELPEPEPPRQTPEPEQPPEEPEPETPAAQVPQPGEFQAGREIARSRRPDELPAPRPPASDRPQLTLEDPRATMDAPKGPVQLGEFRLSNRPDERMQSAIQGAIQQGAGRQAVGDGVGASPVGGLRPSQGNVGSGLELLSDPRGVDFRPYLLQVLNSVRRNWYAVIPESARLGLERGRTAIQFSISRTGDVPKLVIANASGSQPLDRAAVAGISASLPFPPLPSEFPGDEIRLQFVFLYNIKP